MKRPAQKVILAVSVAIMLFAGCEEEYLSDTKKVRLIAVENRQLKKQLEQCRKKVEKQEKRYDTDTEKQKKLLDKCLAEKKGLRKRLQKKTRDQLDSILGAVLGQNTKLRDENGKLRERIEKLKEELEKLKGQSGPKPL